MSELTGRERFTISGAYTGAVLHVGVEVSVAEHYVRTYRADVDLAELAIGERVNVTDAHCGTGVWVGRIADADEDLDETDVGEGRR